MTEQQIKTTDEIVIGGQAKAIQKLKAGKFYEAQKIIAEIFKETAKFSPSSKSENAGETPDIKEMDMGVMVGLFESFPNHIAKFVAICADMTEEDLLKDAYPEELNTAFGVCLELNNVMENLKNSMAPLEKLGAAKSKQA